MPTAATSLGESLAPMALTWISHSIDFQTATLSAGGWVACGDCGLRR